MKTLMFLFLLLAAQRQMPKSNPNGIWQADSGSQYELRLSGSNLKVQLVPGSNAKFVKYELDLVNQEEANTYKGTGYFIAKVKENKECRFEVEWIIVVVNDENILGNVPNIVPDPETCQTKERYDVQLMLKRKH